MDKNFFKRFIISVLVLILACIIFISYNNTIKVENDFSNILSIISLLEFETKISKNLSESERYTLNETIETMTYKIKSKKFMEFKNYSLSMINLNKDLKNYSDDEKHIMLKNIEEKLSHISTNVTYTFNTNNSFINRLFEKSEVVISD